MSSFLIDHTLERLRKNRSFSINVTVFDEASRGFYFEFAPIIGVTENRIVLVGDPDQLGNIDISPDAKEHLVGTGWYPDELITQFTQGWFSTVIKQGLLPVELLQINRRSLPVISHLVSRLFYDDQLISGRFDPANPGRFEFIDMANAEDAENQQVGTSWINRRESNLVVNHIVELLSQGTPLESIGVITPYRAQIALIRQKLRGELLFHAKLKEWRKAQLSDVLKIKSLEEYDTKTIQQVLGRHIDRSMHAIINTVDAFQGSQRKIIILSMVRSNDEGAIGFNENINRLRVAFSRAEDQLMVIAHAPTFLGCDIPTVHTIFQSLIDYAHELGSYVQMN